MADTTFETVLPALKAVDNGDGTFSIAVSIAGMPAISGLTAGELLVATGAATTAWQSSGVVLTAPDISGVVTADGALTMPAFTMGGAITINGQVFDAGAGYVEIDTTGKVGLLMDGGITLGGATVLNYIQNLFVAHF